MEFFCGYRWYIKSHMHESRTGKKEKNGDWKGLEPSGRNQK